MSGLGRGVPKALILYRGEIFSRYIYDSAELF